MSHCSQCGGRNPSTASSCLHCGHPLAGAQRGGDAASALGNTTVQMIVVVVAALAVLGFVWKMATAKTTVRVGEGRPGQTSHERLDHHDTFDDDDHRRETYIVPVGGVRQRGSVRSGSSGSRYNSSGGFGRGK